MTEVLGFEIGVLRRVGEVTWELPADSRRGMRVPARVFADEALLEEIGCDGSLEQLAHVATLSGIVDAALAMPDIHQGDGFPIGGVAATLPPDGVISPGWGRLRHQLRRAAARAAAGGH